MPEAPAMKRDILLHGGGSLFSEMDHCIGRLKVSINTHLELGSLEKASQVAAGFPVYAPRPVLLRMGRSIGHKSSRSLRLAQQPRKAG